MKSALFKLVTLGGPSRPMQNHKFRKQMISTLAPSFDMKNQMPLRFPLTCFAAVCFSLPSGSNSYASGLVDSFSPPGETHMTLGGVKSIAAQGDGMTLLGGQFDRIGSDSVANLARFTVSGDLDTSFSGGTNGIVEDIQVQPDGRIVIAGSFTRVNGVSRYALARLNSDGSFDSSLSVTVNGSGYSVLVLPSGEIVLGGLFNRVNGTSCSGLVKLSSTGALLDTYSGGVGLAEKVGAMALQSNGSIVIGGRFSTVAGSSRSNLARINASGVLDDTFTVGTNNEVFCVLAAVSGHVVFGGMFSQAGGVARSYLARCNANGALDSTFAPAMGYRVYELANQMDGKVLAACSSYTGSGQKWLYRFSSAGTLDATFNPRMNGGVVAMRERYDGRINIAGNFTSIDGQVRDGIARLNGFKVLETEARTFNALEGQTVTLDQAGIAGGSFSWSRNGVPVQNGGRISGATSSKLIITGASSADDGPYVCRGTASGVTQTSEAQTVMVVMKPAVATEPLSRLVAEGTPVTFTTAAMNATGVSYKWFFNNVAIAGATSASYTIASPLITNGGSYRCELRNAAGFVYTQYAYLSVVRFTTATLTVADASTVKMNVTVGAAPAAGVTYLWRLGGVAVSNGVQPSGASISGATTNAITIANIMAAQAGAWTCQITASALTLTPTVGNITVKYRPVVAKSSAPAALVSGPFTWQLTASNSPTLFTVSGLPSGLKYTPATGLISGTPLVAGAFTIRAAAANDAGTGPTESLSLPISTLDNSRTGTWTVSIPRHRALNGYLGGLATFVVSTAGTYTGSVANGVSPVAVSGRVTAPVGGNPTILQRIVRPGLLDLWLNITLNPTNGSLVGTLSDGTDTANVSGGKLAFGASNLASSYSGLYNTTADIRSVYSADTFPQGRGYVQLNVSARGPVTGAGRAGDGTAYSVSSAMWADARFPVYVQMYAGRGSMSGIAQVSLGATAATTDDRISSTFSWFKMPSLSATERLYAAGFDIPDVVWVGSRWTATTRGQLPAGWTIKASNGRIAVTRGSTETAAQSASLVQNFSLATTGGGTFDKLLNLGSITCSANLATGLCTGSFRLTDPATPPYGRTASYYALMIPHLGNTAYGWFTLPKLPQSGETLATSPMLAGRVDVVAQ